MERLTEEIFLAAAQLPADERQAYLDRACGDNQALREEVESMLAFDGSASMELGAVIGGAAVSVIQAESHIGRRFGPYVAISLLGSGGMGAVYLASRADDQIQRQVAIKLVKAGIDSASLVERFRYERQILATLDHPYIGKLLDAGTTADGVPYFVMEYIQGLPIDRYCADSGLTVDQRCELFRKVCEAVAYAHRNLIIHRDLKPSNILVTKDGMPKLLDFGIAKILTPGAESHTVAGGTGVLALTPDYASPEQVRGEPVNTATDVYSLGAVLYELLTGIKPHTLTAYTPVEIERSVCQGEVRRPSEVAPAAMRQQLLGDLDTIIMMAIRKEPERRYQSVEQLSEDLKRYAVGLPVRAREDTVGYRMGKFWRRHRVGMVAAGLAAGSLVGGAGAAAWQARRAHIQQKLAEQRLVQIAALANTTLFDIHAELERLQGATDARKKMVEATLAYLDGLANTSGGDAGILDVLSSAYMRLGDVQGLPDHPNLDDTKGAEASYRKALAVAQHGLALHPNQVPILGTIVDIEERLGLIYVQMGQTPVAVEHTRAALAAAEKRIKLDPKGLESQNLLGSAHMELALRLAAAKPQEALDHAQQALSICLPLSEAHPQDLMLVERVSDIRSMLGRAYAQNGHREEALAQYHQTAALRERLVAARPNDRLAKRELMLAYAHIATVLGTPWSENLGRPAEALEYFKKAARIAEAIAASNPEDRLAQHDLANALLRQGSIVTTQADNESALAALRRSATIVENLAAHNSTNSANADDLSTIYETTGSRLAAMGRRSEALGAYRKSLAIAQERVAQDPHSLTALSNLMAAGHGIARILAAQGDRDGAVRAIRQSMAAVDGALARGVTAPRVRAFQARTRAWLGDTYRALGNWREAKNAYAESLAEWQKSSLGKDGEMEMHTVESALAECERHLPKT